MIRSLSSGRPSWSGASSPFHMPPESEGEALTRRLDSLAHQLSQGLRRVLETLEASVDAAAHREATIVAALVALEAALPRTGAAAPAPPRSLRELATSFCCSVFRDEGKLVIPTAKPPIMPSGEHPLELSTLGPSEDAKAGSAPGADRPGGDGSPIAARAFEDQSPNALSALNSKRLDDGTRSNPMTMVSSERGGSSKKAGGNKWDKVARMSAIHGDDHLEKAMQQISKKAAKHRHFSTTISKTLEEAHLFEYAGDLTWMHPQTESWLYRFTHSYTFHVTSLVFIVANAVSSGWSINMEAEIIFSDDLTRSDYTTSHGVLAALKVTFSILLFLEVSSHVAGRRMEFFTSEDRNWNIFDLLLATSVIGELIVSSASDSAGSAATGMLTLRVLRVLRLVRILRVIRVMRWFAELRLMVQQIICSFRMLLWVFTLVAIVLYMVAMVITQGVIDWVQTAHENSLDIEGNTTVVNLAWYAEMNSEFEAFLNMPRTMLSLFEAVTGGKDWSDYLSPLWRLGFMYQLLYVSFIAFMVFATMNIVTAIFMEHAVKTGQADSDLVLKQELAAEQDFVEEMTSLFQSADHDENGCLVVEELEDFLNDPAVRARLKVLGLEVHEACGLFKLLDLDDKGQLTVQEFATGCLRLRGQARNVDVAGIMKENKRMMKTLMTHLDEVKIGLAKLHGERAGDVSFVQRLQAARSGTTPAATPSTKAGVSTLL